MGVSFDDKTSAEIVKDLIDQVMAVAAKDALIGMHRGLGNDEIVELLKAENEPLVYKAIDTANYIIHAMDQREPVKPYLNSFLKWNCGNGCGTTLMGFEKFCPQCGRPIRWE